jgi:hypothetical protein
MKQSLRDFLRTRCAMTDAELDKLESGDRPDDGKTLRKGAPSDADDSGRFHPGFATVRKCVELLDEIKQSLNSINKMNAHNEAFARGVALFEGGQMNGYHKDKRT